MLSSNRLQLVLAICFLCCVVVVTSNPCANKTSCHECIQTKDCAWCSEPNRSGQPKCFLEYTQNACDDRYIHNPQTRQTVLLNRELSRASYEAGRSSALFGASGSFGSSDEIVQLSPQRASLKLRINEVHNLQFRYSQAEDYPVDLYFLMDMSKSMEADKEKVVALADLLSQTLRNITSNFRLGFGSFVNTRIPINSGNSSCDQCDVSYGFRNHMPLSADANKFDTEVKKAALSGNLAAHSGNLDVKPTGLNALMQAIVCRQQIGWREQARRLLVFSTNAGFQYAGELGTGITPNDGECHLNSEGVHTLKIAQDYPSISKINNKVYQNMVNVIFAVTPDQYSVYAKLSRQIDGSITGVLSNDSSNVADLVREEYSKISSSIEIKDNATSHVKISYHSSCLHGWSESVTSRCDGLKVGNIVSFTAKVIVTSCPADPKDWNQVLHIYPVGSSESLVIDLELQCSCNCERPEYPGYEINSAQCNNHGKLMCGVCNCDDMYFGDSCECYTTNVHSRQINDNACRADNTSIMDCSGRGACVCGICECEKRINFEELIYGRYCECDNYSCARHDRQLCSGPDHGTCECGICLCRPGWTGDDCSCKTSNDGCIPPDGGEICSGHGECVCGECQCKATEEGRYSGHYCEQCPTCAGRCEELKDCTQCQVYGTGPLKDVEDCRTSCSLLATSKVDKLEIDETKGERLCVFYDEDDCKFEFKYLEDKDRIKVIAKSERKCPESIFSKFLKF